MRVITHSITYPSRSDIIRITPIGDIHLGNALCDEKLLAETVARIKADPLHYWGGMGDYCLSDDTEILTDRGWLGMNDVEPSDQAVVYEPGTGVCRFDPILRKWTNPTTAGLVRLKSGHIDALVTKKHRVLIHHNTGGRWHEQEIVEAKDLLKNKTKHIWRLPVAAKGWEGTDKGISEDWFTLKGWIDTEGWLERRGNHERVAIGQSETANPKYVAAIEALFDRLCFAPWRYRKPDGLVFWRFRGADTQRIHDIIGRKGQRMDWMMNSPISHLRAYFKALMDGDGAWSRNCFSQKDAALVNVFQELCFKLGYRVKISRAGNPKRWYCHFGERRGTHSLLREVKEETGSGMTWCVSTPTGTIVTRRNHKIVVLGNCDFINRSDKRHRASHTAPWLHGVDDLSSAQIDKVVKILDPIKDKCLWLVRGNHEDLVHKKYEHDVYAEICRKLGAREKNPLELGYRGFVRLRMRRNKGNTFTVVIYIHHGYGGGRMEGAKALKLGRLPKTYDADIYLYGHAHVRLAQAAHRVSPAKTADRLVGRDLWELVTGSFLRSYDAKGKLEVYSEEKDFPPTALGVPEIQITPDKKRIKVLA